MCDYYETTEVREDYFCWDMENLFIPGNMKDFNVRVSLIIYFLFTFQLEFEQPIGFNEIKTPLVGIMHYKQYNTYFKAFTAKNVALDKVIVEWKIQFLTLLANDRFHLLLNVSNIQYFTQ